FGARALRELFAKNIGLAHRLHGLVREHPNFEVLHEPSLYVYSFRYVPIELADRCDEPEISALLDRLNEEIAEAVRRSGVAMIMTTRIRGAVALRMSICSHRTLEEDVDRTFSEIASVGRALSRERVALDRERLQLEVSPC
ncbi:MAG TPA: aspartate aminotransferase family protein, partial [Blastocatellia bacterium]|nr:aspartate aminotransferase family protein [Blastocatellia bacterium]